MKYNSLASRTWDGTKAFFKRSETIFLNRIETVSGVLIAGIAAMDWHPLISLVGTGTAFNKTQMYSLGGLLVARGVIGEWARRRGTKEVEGSLVPKVESLPKKLRVVKKNTEDA